MATRVRAGWGRVHAVRRRRRRCLRWSGGVKGGNDGQSRHLVGGNTARLAGWSWSSVGWCARRCRRCRLGRRSARHAGGRRLQTPNYTPIDEPLCPSGLRTTHNRLKCRDKSRAETRSLPAAKPRNPSIQQRYLCLPQPLQRGEPLRCCGSVVPSKRGVDRLPHLPVSQLAKITSPRWNLPRL